MAETILESQPDLLIDWKKSDRDDGGACDLRTEEMLVNMGPQHPSTHGVLRIVLRTDGELVLEAIPHIGYLHRCAEKIGENLQPFQFVPTTDRLDYLAAMNNNYGFSLAVEKLAGIEVPERARYIRVIMAELSRIASHLVSFGCYGMDLGAFTPFLYAFRERERILDMFEAACGARLTCSYITIGGVTQDLPERFCETVSEFLDYFEPKIDEYNQLLTYNHIFVKRAANVGVISAEDAIRWGLTGPCLRGSGVKFDLRKSLPYDIYSRFDFEVPVGLPGGSDGIPKEVRVGGNRCGSSGSAWSRCRPARSRPSCPRRSSSRRTRSTSRARAPAASSASWWSAMVRPFPTGSRCGGRVSATSPSPATYAAKSCWRTSRPSSGASIS